MAIGMDHSRVRARRWTRNPLIGLLVVVGMLAGIVGLNAVAGADTTVQPSGPGAVGAEKLVRDSSVTIDVTPGAFMYSKSSSATSNFALTAPALASCRGDLGAINAVGTGNNSPRTE